MAGAVILAVTALLARIGADAQWLAALGHTIVARHGVPAGVPFASAPSSHWPNPLVLAELAFYGLEHGLGDRGLVVAQLLAVAIAFAALARDALQAGANPDRTATAMLIAALGALSSLAIARVQLFSIALFPVLVLVLRADARRPSRRIWLAVPILALWANLHGAVLVGLLVALAYLALSRFRETPWTAIAVGLAGFAALWATPALLHTASYYHGVLSNVAAQRGAGLWARTSPGEPLDDVAIVCIGALAWRARKSGLAAWEWAVIAGLAVLGAGASRSLVWLLLFLVGPAARSSAPARREWGYLAPLSCAAALALTGFAIARGPSTSSYDPPLVARAVALAHGSPVLASDILAERVALDGGRIWLGNPIDAFSHHDQGVYLDWLQGSRAGLRALVPSVHLVLVSRDSASAGVMARAHGFALLAGDRVTLLYARAR